MSVKQRMHTHTRARSYLHGVGPHLSSRLCSAIYLVDYLLYAEPLSLACHPFPGLMLKMPSKWRTPHWASWTAADQTRGNAAGALERGAAAAAGGGAAAAVLVVVLVDVDRDGTKTAATTAAGTAGAVQDGTSCTTAALGSHQDSSWTGESLQQSTRALHCRGVETPPWTDSWRTTACSLCA